MRYGSFSSLYLFQTLILFQFKNEKTKENPLLKYINIQLFSFVVHNLIENDSSVGAASSVILVEHKHFVFRQKI